MASWNSVCIAAVMSPSVVISKYKPGEAQLCMLDASVLSNGAIQVLYQELVGSGRYSVYRTAIIIPRFFTVVHIDVLKGCWQRVPSSGCEHDVEFTSSSTPSETMNTTSWGVLFAEPVPGFGMRVLTAVIADSKLVSVSLLLVEHDR